jgi:outer membrane receptor protein involved in Fe transport
MQTVIGAEYFMPNRRLYLRGEAYWKQLSNLISYTVENVRVEYSGENDAEGHVYGLDLQVRGELVPGLESWVNYSYLVAREEFLPSFSTTFNEGSIPRPTDQRHTFSMFVQDYIPTDPTWKLHMRALFGSGLPYTPPVPGDRVGNLVIQAPGDRFSARYPEFRRIDMGVTKYITLTENGLSNPIKLELTAELLNVFDMTNTVAYSWIPDATGIWQRVPTRLTPRTFNLRLRTTF